MASVAQYAFAMPSRSRSSGRQVHPKGELRTIDDVLRKRVRDALEQMDLDQKDLATKVGVSAASITNLLKPGPPSQIKYLPKLLRVLGIEDDLETVVRGWPDLPEAERAAIAALVKSRSAKR
jgi:transcriptional regulator with XRE-family HTH domain